MTTKKTKLAVVLGAAAIAAGMSNGAWAAGTATSNITVTASITQTCAITANPIAFGAYDPVTANATVAATSTSTLDVRCTKGSSGVTVQLSTGANASGNQKRMTNGTDFLSYSIFQPTTGVSGNTACSTTEWGAPTAALTVTPATAWSATVANSFTMCGSVPAAQNVGAGSYTDTVVATISF